MRIAFPIREWQAMYKAPWVSLAERQTLVPFTGPSETASPSDMAYGTTFFDLFASTAEGDMRSFGLNVETSDIGDIFFWGRLPEPSDDGTTIGSCTFRARKADQTGGPTDDEVRVLRYWSAEVDPIQTTDWIEIGDSGDLSTELTQYSFSDPGVTTATHLGFRFVSGGAFGGVRAIDLRQQVLYDRQPIEIANSDGSQVDSEVNFATMFRGSIPATGVTHDLSVRNETGANITVAVRRVARHQNIDALEILNRIFLSTDNTTYTNEDITDWTVPDGGLPFWLRYLPQSTNQSVSRQTGLAGLYLEVTQP